MLDYARSRLLGSIFACGGILLCLWLLASERVIFAERAGGAFVEPEADALRVKYVEHIAG